ncbi:MAG: hypothetical protein HYU66_13305 [Armatimonadetes bacterium]|nr:hypothetical protein [Armatimonadota bacterium]
MNEAELTACGREPEVVEPERENDSQRKAWTPPTLTRVEVRRTLLSPGTNIDGFSGSSFK